MKKSLLVLLVILNGAFANQISPTVSKSDAINSSRLFVAHLTGDDLLTVNDFYGAYGQHAEEEIAAELQYCQTVLVRGSDECLSFHKERYANGEFAISYYLEWLRHQLPKQDGRIRLVSETYFERANDQCWYLLLYEVKDTRVEVKANACAMSLELGGKHWITSIDGERIADLWAQYSPVQ